MAKEKYKEWLEPQNLLRVQGWAMDGLTDEQIAENMGIRRETLWEWKKKYPNINNALKVSKDIADRQIENALFKAAKEGNITAQIFWLKNRKVKEWRDKHDLDLTDENEKININITRKQKKDE